MAGISLEMILLAFMVLVLNVMDSVTTNLCFKQYPDKELKGEANPFMRWLMLKSRVLAEVFKQGLVLGLVIWWFVGYHLEPLRYVAIMLGLVVLNNSTVVVSRLVTKRRVPSPIKKVTLVFHIPDKYGYVVALAIIFSLAMGIYKLAWG